MTDYSNEGAESVLRKWAEAVNRKDLATAQGLLHPEYRDAFSNDRDSVFDYPWWEGTTAASLWPHLDTSRTKFQGDRKARVATDIYTSIGNPHVAPVRAKVELRPTSEGWRVSAFDLVDLYLPDLEKDRENWRPARDRPTSSSTKSDPVASTPRHVAVQTSGGVPTVHVDHRPDSAQMMMCFNPTPDQYRYFAEEGVQWVSFDSTPTAHDWRVVKTVWIAPDKFDYSELDAHFSLLATENPHAFFLPMVFFGTPPWWAEAHPDHVMQYETRAGTFLPLKNCGRKVASWASHQWRQDSLDALDRYLDHIERQPYGERVAGYYLTSGGGGEEWFQYAGPEGEFSDYSPANRDGWRGWLREKYETDEALRHAWGRGSISLSSIEIPRGDRRTERGPHSFHHPRKDRDILDLMDYVAHVTASTLEGFARHIKERTGGTKLCGAFFGYISSIVSEPREHDSGHLGIPEILKSPHLDFLSSPTAYTHRRPGIGHRKTMGANASLKLHNKLWWSQMDDRSCLAADRVAIEEELDLPFEKRWGSRRRIRLATVNGYHGLCDTLEETLQAQWSSFAMSFVQSLGHYWFDMQGGWYDEASMMEAVGQMKRIADQALFTDRTPIHDVAFVVSSASRRFSKQSSHLSVNLIEAQEYYLGKMGAPYNFYLLEDLEKIPPHKFWIFPNAFSVDDKTRAAIRHKTEGADVLWFHGAGYVDQEDFSLESASELTGFRLGCQAADFPQIEILDNEHRATRGLEKLLIGQALEPVTPLLYVDDPGARVLARLTDSFRPGLAAKSTPSGTRYFSSSLYLPPAILRGMGEAAGVHFYTQTNDTVLANASWLAFSNTEPGTKTISLPGPTDLFDVRRNETVGRATDSLVLHCEPKETRIFYLGSEADWRDLQAPHPRS